MIRRLPFLLPLAVVALALSLLLARLGVPAAERDALPSTLVDRPVPDFALPSPDGQAPGLASGDLVGKVRVLNVFASWCLPCRVEHPSLLRLAEREGIEVVGLAYKDEPQALAAYLAELGNPFARIGADRQGRVAIEFGVYGVPETFVIDAAGRVRLRHVGQVTERDLEATILPLVRELSP